jgi:hypothetical protein
VSARLELYFVAFFVLQRVFDADLAIKFISAFQGDFGFFREVRMGRRENLLAVPGMVVFGFSDTPHLLFFTDGRT